MDVYIWKIVDWLVRFEFLSWWINSCIKKKLYVKFLGVKLGNIKI